MKRLLAVIFAIALCLSAFTVSAFATDGEISLTSAQGQPGGQVVVDVNLSGNTGIAYLKLKISYDSNVLTLQGAENTGVLEGTFTTSKTTDVNPYVLQWMAAGNSVEDGIIATLTFTILETAQSGSYPITVSVEECYDETYQQVGL